jgi:hypothetical protein
VERRENRIAAETIARLKKFVPKLREYGKRKAFTKGERSYIQKVNRALRYTDNLYPATKKQAEKFKEQMWQPRKYVRDKETGETYSVPIKGVKVRAFQFRNTGKEVRLHTVRNDLLLTSNGRDYLYWSLDNVSTAAMKKAGEKAFDNFRNSFPAERLAALAERAFKVTKIKAVYLWGARGRCNEGFADMDAFLEWLFDQYSYYADKDAWVNGLVLAI